MSSLPMDTKESDKQEMGLDLGNESSIEQLVLTFKIDKESFEKTITKEELEFWIAQSSKIKMDINDLTDETCVQLLYSPSFLHNYFEEKDCDFDKVWNIIKRYVIYHKTGIGVVYDGYLTSKVLASCTEDNNDADLIEETIGRNLSMLYSTMTIAEYLGMEPLSKLLNKKLETHTIYEPATSHADILDYKTPVVYYLDDWCGNREEKSK
jgi:hypothetical protein